MEGVHIIDQKRCKQRVTLRSLRDASIKQGKRLAKKKKDRISGKDVDFIYLKKDTYLKFSATKMYKI